jgi:hypothetical protein
MFFNIPYTNINKRDKTRKEDLYLRNEIDLRGMWENLRESRQERKDAKARGDGLF